MRILKVFLVVLLCLMVLYIVGPRPVRPDFDHKPVRLEVPLDKLDKFISDREAEVPNLREDNEARIIWADSIPERTAYSIVYLHGFSASAMEGEPVHRRIAARYGANLYLARLAGHGIDSRESFAGLTPEALYNSAKEALAVGRLIGDSVILMSCSTGGTLSLFMAAHQPGIHSLIMYSPNIEFARPGSDVLTKPWGLQLARMMFKGKYRSISGGEIYSRYWTRTYRLEGLVQLKKMVETTMVPETFTAVDQPVFMGYYYKNEEQQDDIVSVADMLEMYEVLGTPLNLKRRQAFPEAGSHIICTGTVSGDIDGVIRGTESFCEEVLGMRPVRPD